MAGLINFLPLFQVLVATLGGPLHIAKRQAATANWVAGEFSQCSVMCNGGLQVRSVRCLTRDGIISNSCSNQDRPASYMFCGQVDCVTGIPDLTLLPPSGTFNFDVENTSSASLQFVNQGPGNYEVLLNVTELDGTSTTVMDTVTPQGTQTRISVSGANPTISLPQVGDTTSLATDGQDILVLNGVETVDLGSQDSLTFQGGEIIVGNETVATGIRNLTYFDGLRFYRFEDDLQDPLNGPGVLYFNPATGQAFFSINPGLNMNLNQVISTLDNTATPTEISVTPEESTDTAITTEASTPVPVTTEDLTTQLPEATPTTAASTQLPETTAVTETPTQLPPMTTQPPASTNTQPMPTTETTKKPDEEPDEECEEEETSKSTRKSRKSKLYESKSSKSHSSKRKSRKSSRSASSDSSSSDSSSSSSDSSSSSSDSSSSSSDSSSTHSKKNRCPQRKSSKSSNSRSKTDSSHSKTKKRDRYHKHKNRG